jgi:hypothetical protein
MHWNVCVAEGFDEDRHPKVSGPSLRIELLERYGNEVAMWCVWILQYGRYDRKGDIANPAQSEDGPVCDLSIGAPGQYGKSWYGGRRVGAKHEEPPCGVVGPVLPREKEEPKPERTRVR